MLIFPSLTLTGRDGLRWEAKSYGRRNRAGEQTPRVYIQINYLWKYCLGLLSFNANFLLYVERCEEKPLEIFRGVVKLKLNSQGFVTINISECLRERRGGGRLCLVIKMVN